MNQPYPLPGQRAAGRRRRTGEDGTKRLRKRSARRQRRWRRRWRSAWSARWKQWWPNSSSFSCPTWCPSGGAVAPPRTKYGPYRSVQHSPCIYATWFLRSLLVLLCVVASMDRRCHFSSFFGMCTIPVKLRQHSHICLSTCPQVLGRLVGFLSAEEAGGLFPKVSLIAIATVDVVLHYCCFGAVFFNKQLLIRNDRIGLIGKGGKPWEKLAGVLRALLRTAALQEARRWQPEGEQNEFALNCFVCTKVSETWRKKIRRIFLRQTVK